MRIQPARSIPIYRPGWGGAHRKQFTRGMLGLGQCYDDLGNEITCDGSTPPVVTTGPQPPPVYPTQPTSAGGGLTPAQLIALIQGGSQSAVNLYRALQPVGLVPGTNVILNPATGQFYNPQTGQVVSPIGATPTTAGAIGISSAQTLGSYLPILMVVGIGAVLVFSARGR